MSSTPRSRRRKAAILTQAGFQKLQVAQSQSDIWNHDLKTCTLEALSEQTGLSPHTIGKVHARRLGVDIRTLVRYFSAFDLMLDKSDYTSPIKNDAIVVIKPMASFNQQHLLSATSLTATASIPIISWGTAPDVSRFYGRTHELATLREWIVEQRCRLITLSGMGGIGKTWLTTKLVEQIQPAFKVVIWRSLRPLSGSQQPLSCDDLLDDLLRQCAPQSSLSSSATTHTKVVKLIDCLQKMPCLLILDNVESILQRSGSNDSDQESLAGRCQFSHEAYDQLFQIIGQGRHQSCLVLTSREEPNKVQQLSGEHRWSRCLSLDGLNLPEIKEMFEAKGCFQGNADEWNRLVTYYGGNPLILEMVATTIQILFNGSITEFLRHNILLFDDICELINQQIGGLSASEKVVMVALAKQDKPYSFSKLRSQLPSPLSGMIMLTILKSLRSRSLLAKVSAEADLPSVKSTYIKDYVKAYWSVA